MPSLVVAAALPLAACATDDAGRRALAEVTTLRSQVDDVRQREDGNARDIARIQTQIRALEADTAEKTRDVRAASVELARARVLLEEARAALREAHANAPPSQTVTSVPAVTPPATTVTLPAPPVPTTPSPPPLPITPLPDPVKTAPPALASRPPAPTAKPAPAKPEPTRKPEGVAKATPDSKPELAKKPEAAAKVAPAPEPEPAKKREAAAKPEPTPKAEPARKPEPIAKPEPPAKPTVPVKAEPPRPPARSGSPAGDLFNTAMANFRAQEHGQAVLELTDLIARFPEDALAPAAQLWIGEAYYQQRDYRQSLTELKRVLDVYPKSPQVADALLKTGLCHRAMGDRGGASAAWEQVVRDHPASAAAGQARALLGARDSAARSTP